MTTLKDLIARRFGIETGGGRSMPAEGALAQILGRGSQRHYTDKPVTDDLLAVLLACAQSAPTKSDLQQYSIIVVKDPAVREALVGLGSGMEWAPKAPAFLVFCADIRRIRRLAEIRGHTYQNDNLDTFMNGVVDAALAMQSFITAAESVGLGTCPISQIRNKIDRACEILGLPDGVFPIAGLAVGWPKFEKPLISMRLPPSVVVHTDRYDDSDLEQEVEAYDRRRHAERPIAKDKQRHTAKYGALDYCPWSEQVTRQLSLPERAGFKPYLKAHGMDIA
jgi:nitroreductase/FMN reductase [NAD(P)H]